MNTNNPSINGEASLGDEVVTHEERHSNQIIEGLDNMDFEFNGKKYTGSAD